MRSYDPRELVHDIEREPPGIGQLSPGPKMMVMAVGFPIVSAGVLGAFSFGG